MDKKMKLKNNATRHTNLERKWFDNEIVNKKSSIFNE